MTDLSSRTPTAATPAAPVAIVGYTFDLRTNMLKPETVDNPAAGKEHKFGAYRVKDAASEKVAMRPPRQIIAEIVEAAEEDE